MGTVSQFAHILNDNGSSLGQHTSSFAPGQSTTKPDNGGATGRLGVGNAARTDGMPGDSANSHFAGQIAKYDSSLVTQPPGNNDNPNRNGNPNAPSG